MAISYLPEEEDDAQETQRWVEEAGRRVLPLPGDIQDEAHCVSHGRPGRRRVRPARHPGQQRRLPAHVRRIEEISTEEFDRTFRTNVYAMFWLCRAALPRMRPGSTIINTASIQAYDPSPHLLAYAPTKAAIVNFTKALAQMAMKQACASTRSRPARSGPADPVDDARREGEDSSAPTPPSAAPPSRSKSRRCSCSWRPNEARFVTGEVYGATGGQSPF